MVIRAMFCEQAFDCTQGDVEVSLFEQWDK